MTAEGDSSGEPGPDGSSRGLATGGPIPEGGGSRAARWSGLVGLVARRLLARSRRRFPDRTALTVLLVALAVGLLVVITSVGLGLATGTTVYGADVDYWIVPESGSTGTTLFSTEGPQLGDVHAVSADLRGREGVTAASPVLVELVRMRAEGGDAPEYVLGVGVLPDQTDEIAGLSTASLTDGDPYYAGGEYDGEFTGEVVLSPAAAEVLGAESGGSLRVAGASGRIRENLEVTAIDTRGGEQVSGQVPIAVMHLSELQAITGATSGDQADQILIRTNNPSVKPVLEGAYPEATVVSGSGLSARQLFDSDLPLVMSLVALVVGLAVGALFVATTASLAVEAERSELAVFAALGFSGRTVLGLVGLRTVLVTLVGGVLGLVVGGVGILSVNLGLTAVLGLPAVARVHPLLALYGVGVAVVMGLLALPYPLVLARRTNVVEELER